MTYSFVTYSKQGKYYLIVFACDLTDEQLVIKFLPTTELPFSSEHIDLVNMRLRDPYMILSIIESYGITLILKGLK